MVEHKTFNLPTALLCPPVGFGAEQPLPRCLVRSPIVAIIPQNRD